MEVHNVLGCGFLEAIYQEALEIEFVNREIPYIAQKELPVFYKRRKLNKVYLADFMVFDKVIVEIKAVERLEPIHEAQLLSYLKLSGCEVGLLINFNVKVVKNGIRRLVNRFKD